MNPNTTQPTSLLALLGAVRQHIPLIKQLTKREVIGRYRGSILGVGWSFLNPLLMLLVFTFVFSVVFEARWDVQIAGKEEDTPVFAVILFIGLILHGFFSEMLTRSPTLVISNVNYVKKVVFPLESLPVVVIMNAIFHAVVSFCIWLLVYLLLVGLPPVQALFIPVVLLPLITLSLGISFILASLGVFLRDINQTMGILSTVLLFMSPVFFPIDRLPEAYQPLFLANPLTFIIQQARDVLIWGQTPDFIGLAIYMTVSLFILWMGFYWFQKTRKGFADVL